MFKKKMTTEDFLKELSFDFKGFYDEKTFDRFVKAVERIVRKDRSYLNYITKIKEGTELLKDVIFNNLSSMDVTIEMHHHPFTLYDVVSTVALHNFNNNITFTSFSLAKEVINLHYRNLVGLAPMSITTHELAHLKLDRSTKRRYISLTKKQLFGKYDEFAEIYKDGMTLTTKQKLVEFEEISSDLAFKIDQKDLFK